MKSYFQFFSETLNELDKAEDHDKIIETDWGNLKRNTELKEVKK